jgi:hypothetical protein
MRPTRSRLTPEMVERDERGLMGVSGGKGTGAGLPAAVAPDQKGKVAQSDAVIEVSGLQMSYDGFEAVSEVIKLVGLKNKANARGKQLSGGQQRRMDVGCPHR